MLAVLGLIDRFCCCEDDDGDNRVIAGSVLSAGHRLSYVHCLVFYFLNKLLTTASNSLMWFRDFFFKLPSILIFL